MVDVLIALLLRYPMKRRGLKSCQLSYIVCLHISPFHKFTEIPEFSVTIQVHVFQSTGRGSCMLQRNPSHDAPEIRTPLSITKYGST